MTGLEKLRERAERNIEHGWDRPRVEDAFNFAVDRAKQWESKTGIPFDDILSKWVDDCDYSFVNYFQDANQPLIDEDTHIINSKEDLDKLSEKGFRCPYCKGVSTDYWNCNSGVLVHLINGNKRKVKKPCNWSAGGLFRTLQGGAKIFVRPTLKQGYIFMPIAWEKNNEGVMSK